MRKGYAIFLFGCVLFEEERALLLAKREDDGEGLECSHELFFQFGDLSFVEGQVCLLFLDHIYHTTSPSSLLRNDDKEAVAILVWEGSCVYFVGFATLIEIEGEVVAIEGSL